MQRHSSVVAWFHVRKWLACLSVNLKGKRQASKWSALIITCTENLLKYHQWLLYCIYSLHIMFFNRYFKLCMSYCMFSMISSNRWSRKMYKYIQWDEENKSFLLTHYGCATIQTCSYDGVWQKATLLWTKAEKNASGMHGVKKVKLNNIKRNSFKERN